MREIRLSVVREPRAGQINIALGVIPTYVRNLPNTCFVVSSSTSFDFIVASCLDSQVFVHCASYNLSGLYIATSSHLLYATSPIFREYVHGPSDFVGSKSHLAKCYCID